MKEIRIHVFGTVQGVFFRANTQKEAQKLGLVGYVRNLPDGSVEIVAQGDEEKLKELLEWSYHGPNEAEVKHLEFNYKDLTINTNKFEIRY